MRDLRRLSPPACGAAVLRLAGGQLLSHLFRSLEDRVQGRLPSAWLLTDIGRRCESAHGGDPGARSRARHEDGQSGWLFWPHYPVRGTIQWRHRGPAMLTIALAQMDVRTGQPEANLAKARTFAAQAQEAGADLLLFPELWLHGYDLEQAEEWASPLGEGGFSRMEDLARDHGLYLSGTGLERHGGGVSNTSVLYGPDGTLLGSYRKIHLFPLMGETRYLVAGDHATVCETPWGPVGLTICYDLRFPELYRTLALAGVVLILVPAQWPVPRLDAWLLLARARAVENELFVAACNRAGAEGIATFPGRSAVIDPWGKALVEGDDQERLLVARLELKEIQKARRYLTVFDDRRPEAYRVGADGRQTTGNLQRTADV